MTSISLKKGEKISLAKVDPGVKKLLIGMGWRERVSPGVDFDLDASAFLLNEHDMVEEARDFVFYNMKHRRSLCNSVRHLGDNKKGTSGNQDAEQIEIDLETLPARIHKVVCTITIYEALKHNQTFGMVDNAFARVVNRETGNEILRFDLREEYTRENSLQVIEIYRHGNEWRVGTLGTGFIDGLAGLCRNFGLDVDAE